jgi:hypothetical protein
MYVWYVCMYVRTYVCIYLFVYGKCFELEQGFVDTRYYLL